MTNSPADPAADTLAEDKLRGVAEIAAYIDESPRRTNYLLEKGQIPGWKVGRIWYSSRSALRRRFAGEAA